MLQSVGKRDQGPCYLEDRDHLSRATFAVKESLTRLTIAERRIQTGLQSPVRRRRHKSDSTQDLFYQSATTSEPLQAQLERTLANHCRRESLESTDTQSPGSEIPRIPPKNVDAASLSNRDQALLQEVSAWRTGGEELEELKNAIASMQDLCRPSPFALRPGLRRLPPSKSRAETPSNNQRTATGPRTPTRPGSAPAGGRMLHQFAFSDPVLCRTPSRRATKNRSRRKCHDGPP
mmetsp:Transcript_53411/g.106274  ORF Transcript_53411/g.106274 Transcript_53411/m.106274 type:complete len:234 (+) Transcript_53411:54-755(+)